ncbi:hypothetical protein BU17DRAFT_39611 [Hysterangium stoloniferum]|nr:hypothetical protein BU17DRAFT_39611 [Hysterangium stoloniferum]
MPHGPETETTIFFWKPTQKHGYLGQWYPSPFVTTEADGSHIYYKNAEQYMMHRKGLLFAPNHEVTAKILKTTNPKAIKALGRAVPNFNEGIWVGERYKIVVEGNYLKFTQNEHLKEQLLATGNKELVEASPRDRIWGIGFGWENAEKQRARWGQNLLGKATMEVRKRIRREMDQSADEEAQV